MTGRQRIRLSAIDQRITVGAAAPAVFCALTCVLVGALTGCQIGGEGDVRVHNTQLRQENAALKTEIDAMQTRVEGLLAQIESADQADESPLRSQRLVLTEIRIGRYTTPMDTDKDGQDDVLKVDLTTHDQDGYAFAAKGAVELKLAVLDEAGAEIALLAATRFTGDEVQAAYRNGLLGTQYVLKAPVSFAGGRPEGAASVVVFVAMEDAYTGAVLEASRPVSVKW